MNKEKGTDVTSSSNTYRSPGEDIEQIIDAPPTPIVKFAPGGHHMVMINYSLTPPLEMVARPFHKLGGLRIDADTGTARRTYNMFDITITHVDSGESFTVGLPEHGIRICTASWSPDGSRLVYTILTEEGIELWGIEIAEQKNHRLAPDLLLNDTLGRELHWAPGSRDLYILAVPEGRPAAPEAPRVPVGPKIQQTRGQEKQNRTYTDLLEDEFSDALFTHYTTSQVWRVDTLGERAPEKVGGEAMYNWVSSSPDGMYLMVKKTLAPFSRTVPAYFFAYSLELWTAAGEHIRTITEQPVADAIPIQGVRTGPRHFGWQPLEDATMYWAECLDNGDPKVKVEHREKLLSLSAPFTDAPTELARLKERYRGSSWLDRPGVALVTEYDWERRWLTTRLWDWNTEGSEPRVIFDLSVHERYNHPGSPFTRKLPTGKNVISVFDGSKIYLAGDGATPDGDRPFLDLFDLETLESERIFHSSDTQYETLAGFGPRPEQGEGVDERARDLVIWRESPTTPPNYIRIDHDTGEERALTAFADPHPQLTGVTKQLLKYEREDGVPLSGTLYLPPGYKEGDKLPLVIWAYPIEYSDAATAGQVRAAPTRFTRLAMTSSLMFLTRGYAVLDRATMPVVGDPETMNDTFVEQIVDAAKSSVDAVDELGVIDRDRVAVAGHSYGAFMTANLLAHCDFFRAGIARSGAYNRSLTPFGFQSERRTLWQAPDVYTNLSPFFHADKIKTPLLMIHGEDDPNSGTYPLQSRRLFHAMEGLGGNARLIVLPHEGHGYRARESVLHVLAEQFDWLEEHMG